MIRSGGASQGGIRKRRKHREKMRPSRGIRRRGSRTPIANRIGKGVPIPHHKVKGGKGIGFGRKIIKKLSTLFAFSVRININKLKNLPLEAKGRG